MSIKSDQARGPERRDVPAKLTSPRTGTRRPPEPRPLLIAPPTRPAASRRTLAITGAVTVVGVAVLVALLWPKSPPLTTTPRKLETVSVAVVSPSSAKSEAKSPPPPVKPAQEFAEKVVAPVPVARIEPNPIVEPQQALPLQVSLEQPAQVQATYGTRVTFLNNPVQASQKAAQEQKLVFAVHISGNFEDAHFT